MIFVGYSFVLNYSKLFLLSSHSDMKFHAQSKVTFLASIMERLNVQNEYYCLKHSLIKDQN